MRIQHNITALNAANKLKSNESTVSKNIQKLSSGYRINSAGGRRGWPCGFRKNAQADQRPVPG
jgi:hypothetical protein